MQKIIKPKPLAPGAHIRVITPSSSGKTLQPARIKAAEAALRRAGFRVSYGKHVFESDQFESSSVKSRISDLHNAFADKSVGGILTARGGFNANDLLDYIDWSIIKNNPKMLCGYSDITTLHNAILVKTGLITFSGPNFSTFGHPENFSYTFNNFLNAVGNRFELPLRNHGKMAVLNKGKASGTLVGGNLCTFNLLQGTQYIPDIKNKIIFLEDDHMSPLDWWEFYRNLQSLINLRDFKTVRALVIGKFQPDSKLPTSKIAKIVEAKPELSRIPVIANLNFGHTLPMFTFPVGGQVSIDTSKKNPISFRI